MILIIIIMIILNIIYHISGLLGIFTILIWSINLFMTTMILIQNPNNFWIRVVQVLSIFFIVFIIMLDISTFYNSIYKLAFLIPLSHDKITFFDEKFGNDDPDSSIIYITNSSISWFSFFDLNEISDFLDNLEYNKTYIISFDLIFDFLSYEVGDPSIILTKPILINKETNPKLISNFLNERVKTSCYSYDLDVSCLKDNEGPGILVRYKEINLFWK